MALRGPHARRAPVALLLSAASLLAGTAINVAVAWECVLSEPTYSSSSFWRPTQEDVSWWRSHAPSGIVETPWNVSEFASFGMEKVLMVAQEPGWKPIEPGDTCLWMRCGWPMRSLEGGSWIDRSSHVTIWRYIWRPRWISPLDYPLMPLPLGFAVNTALYAAIAFAMLAAGREYVRQARANLRRRRGLCLKCAYPTGDSDICTECGSPVTKAKSRRPIV